LFAISCDAWEVGDDGNSLLMAYNGELLTILARFSFIFGG
jgi:hypothetical protein